MPLYLPDNFPAWLHKQLAFGDIVRPHDYRWQTSKVCEHTKTNQLKEGPGIIQKILPGFPFNGNGATRLRAGRCLLIVKFSLDMPSQVIWFAKIIRMPP